MQSYVALSPVVIVHIESSQLELVLSPVATSQVAPPVHSMSHELPHIPVQVVPAPHWKSWLPPGVMLHAKPTLQTAIVPVTAQPGPGQVLTSGALASSPASVGVVVPPPQPADPKRRSEAVNVWISAGRDIYR